MIQQIVDTVSAVGEDVLDSPLSQAEQHPASHQLRHCSTSSPEIPTTAHRVSWDLGLLEPSTPGASGDDLLRRPYPEIDHD
ncbi:hypothetical protein [Saccharopolyspora rectivirgula]|uniref:hypothetical protein n=1 Tax=Saccharopolyspora rectivirgula TaxID=28042 RepID=UPI0004A494DC|nr:hypothetical protein [Saccharopolyspora rectivirgula]